MGVALTTELVLRRREKESGMSHAIDAPSEPQVESKRLAAAGNGCPRAGSIGRTPSASSSITSSPLLAFVPWFFSWTGVVACAGRHLRLRHARHQSLLSPPADASQLRCPKWLEHALAILGVCCLQDTPARWVGSASPAPPALRRTARSAQPAGQLLLGPHGLAARAESRTVADRSLYERYAKDLLRERFYMNLERRLVVGVDQPRPVGACSISRASSSAWRRPAIGRRRCSSG